MVEVRVEVRPPSPYRLPRAGGDGVLRRRGTVLERLLHLDGERVVVRAAQPAADRVVVGAWAPRRELCDEGLERMRFALGVDDDLRAFVERFRWDPLIGPSVRRAPWRRPVRRPVAWEALAWAITEQLIEIERALAIQRRIVRGLGWSCAETGLRDVPGPEAVAGCAPARYESWDLAARRARALIRCAREVAAGRIELEGEGAERSWRRLRAIPEIGSWTIGMLAQHGQGRHDVLPAGDLGYRKFVGRAVSGGDPKAVADEAEVLDFFAPYDGWAGLAGWHALHAGAVRPASVAA
jgi:3-methyladenine DNA glycosylase/8-oxoguanine DNA glycosylase